MGFVTKLLSFFAPIIVGIIFFYQRDHILNKEHNDFLDNQFSLLSSQFNHHLDSIVDQMNQFVAENKELVGDAEKDASDEVDLKERIKSAKKSVSKEDVKVEAPVKTVQVEENASKDNQKSKSTKKCNLGNDLLLTKEELSKYNGKDPKKKIYLAFLGIVYDVTKGEMHYAEGGAYSMFTGKDASRAFITGDFSVKGLVDNLSNLNAESFNGVKEWSDLYEKTYKRVGRLIGAFYDQNGCPTEQIKLVEEQLEKANQANLDYQYENELFPPCNTEWVKEKKETRFWCSKLSGGVQRDWVGLPRQLFSINKDKKEFRCACIRDFGPETKQSIEYADEEEDESVKDNKVSKEKNVGDLNNPRVREFAGCSPKSTECIVKDKQ